MKLPTFLYRWPAYWLELFEERAAIMEFQGNMTREKADKQAEQDIRRQAAEEGPAPVQENFIGV